MDRNEQLLLLELILRDIRGNWGWDLRKRVDMACQLAHDMESQAHIARIETFQRMMSDGDVDGRYFRTSYERGGYECMEELHRLPHNLINRSREFREACKEYLTYPESVLDIFGLDGEDE